MDVVLFNSDVHLKSPQCLNTFGYGRGGSDVHLKSPQCLRWDLSTVHAEDFESLDVCFLEIIDALFFQTGKTQRK